MEFIGVTRGVIDLLLSRAVEQDMLFRSQGGVESDPSAVMLRRALSADDAVDIWIARWLRVPRKHLIARYECDPRRLYEIWEEKRFSDSRSRALGILAERHPEMLERVDTGPHRRIPRAIPSDQQLSLFDY
jgi:hypothetical protein